MPVLQWLDFSSTERDDVLTLLESQKDKSTVDELGIGLVRDAISDHLFPGISTIQTRARYFLFVPWALRSLEAGSVREENLASALRRSEVSLIKGLLDTEADRDNGQFPGLIGRESRADTKRLPSTIYWGGLRRLGLYRGAGSLQECLADLPSLRSQRSHRRSVAEDGERSVDDDVLVSWDPGLPDVDPAFPSGCDFDLRPEEARYLSEKVLGLQTASGQVCLLQWMIRHLDTADIGRLEQPWALLDESDPHPALPASLRNELAHARNFALCMRVLTATYCRLLARHRRDLEVAPYDAILTDTLSGLAQHADSLRAWHSDLPAFWRWISLANPRLKRDRPFIEEWLQTLASHGFALGDPAVLTGSSLERRIQSRERILKWGLARLGNPPVLQRWSAPDKVLAIDYRWRTAKGIVHDILNGLGRTGDTPHAGP